MAVTYQDIEAANAAAKVMDIKGTKYIKVSERVKAFRMVYPTGFVETEILTHENGVCVCKAICGYYDDQGNALILGIGTAREKEGTSYINKASYMENCETSAVGRALGFAGFGIDYDIASKEEIDNKGSEMLTKIKNEPASDDALKPGEKVDLPPAGSWNARVARSKWCNEMGISQELFHSLYLSLVNNGKVALYQYDAMQPDQFDAICLAIQQNYPDELRKAT